MRLNLEMAAGSAKNIYGRGLEFLSGGELSDVWNIQIPDFPNLSGLQGLNGQRGAV